MIDRMMALCVVAGWGGLLMAPSGTAWAKKNSGPQEIEMTDIKSFDKVFRSAREIDRKVTSAEKEVDRSQKNLNKALGIKNDEPIGKALAQLNKRADHKISVVMDGTVPKLKATDAVPKNVSDGIDAVNKMTRGFVGSVSDLSGAADEAKKLKTKAQKMPADLRGEMQKDGAGWIELIFKLPKTAKTLTGNTAIILSLPGRTTRVVKTMTEVVGSVKSEFSTGKGR
jgi:hypothetical protein